MVPDGLKVKLLEIHAQVPSLDAQGNAILVDRILDSSHGPVGAVVTLSYSAARDLIRAGHAVEVK